MDKWYAIAMITMFAIFAVLMSIIGWNENNKNVEIAKFCIEAGKTWQSNTCQ